MKRYCFDTSGLTNPLTTIPEDIHTKIWLQVRLYLASGGVAVTGEIYEEMEQISGELGECIRGNRGHLLLEVGDDRWDWMHYLDVVKKLVNTYRVFISEYNKGIKQTICYNDISIVALAKALRIPLVSMEVAVLAPGNTSQKKRRIPDVCKAEGVEHLSFSDFLRREAIQG